MRRISSRQTYFLKRVFPWLMIGFIVVMEGAMVMALVAEGAAENLALLVCVAVVIPLVTLASLWVAMWLLVFGLIDEVWDVGDGLLVRNQGMEFEIAWTDIMSVDYCGWINPQRITLSVRRETPLGRQLVFQPTIYMFAQSSHPIARELKARIAQANALVEHNDIEKIDVR